MGAYHLYHASHSLRKGRGGVSPSTDFETMACMVLESYILPNSCPCYFSYIIISMNYTEELLAHAQTVDTRRFSPQLLSAWEWGYVTPCHYFCHTLTLYVCTPCTIHTPILMQGQPHVKEPPPTTVYSQPGLLLDGTGTVYREILAAIKFGEMACNGLV